MHMLLSSLTILPLMAAPTPIVTADDAEFEAPVELNAGGVTFDKIYYPSPVLKDLNGDGQNELIIGDLMGYLYSASRISADPDAGWAAKINIPATDGESIKFSNW